MRGDQIPICQVGLAHPAKLSILAIALFAVAIACAATRASHCAPLRGPVVIVDGRALTLTTSTAKGGQTLVWIRDLEKIGWGRVEPGRNGSMILRRNAIAITFTEGSAKALVNKLTVEAPAAARTIAGRFMVPLQFVCDSLGYSFAQKTQPVASIKTSSGVRQPTGQANPPRSGYGPPAYRPYRPPSTSGYRPAKLISQSRPPASAADNNSIAGKVTFGGAPVEGVRLRLIDPKGGYVDHDTSVTTDAKGVYAFSGLPDGEYRVYAGVGDNPEYFNRASPVIALANGAESRAGDIALGRILHPVNPTVAGKVTPVNGKAEFTCTSCQSATKYDFSIVDASSKATMASASSTEPVASMDTSSLQPGHDYEWRVTAVDGQGEFLGGAPGCGSPPWTFQITPP